MFKIGKLCVILVLISCQVRTEVVADQTSENNHEAIDSYRTHHDDGAAEGSLGLMFPDLIPFVDESRPYLANWQLQEDTLRIQSVFGNIGDGVFEIGRASCRERV